MLAPLCKLVLIKSVKSQVIGAGNDNFKVFVSSTSTSERTQLNVAVSEKTTGVFEFTLNPLCKLVLIKSVKSQVIEFVTVVTS